jgi:hypothetical protein
MKSNPWIDGSRRAYARLLKLYPQEHRDEYGAEMLQVFGDQCREAYGRKRGWGVLGLWLRSLPDLGMSSLREHITAPNSTAGLLEAVPGRPLPWKGVLLVLLPGLVFLVGQIGQLNGVDWFFTVLYRGAYFLILPVLLVWALKRKFPVWGLIPLGLLYRTACTFIFGRFLGGYFSLKASLDLLKYRYVYYYVSKAYAIVNGVIRPFNQFLQKNNVLAYQIATLILLGSLVALVVVVWRRGIFSKAGWIWLGLGTAVCLAGVLFQSRSYLDAAGGFAWIGLPKFLELVSWEFRDLAQILFIILAGTLLLRRYGSLALLLPLGYMIPSVLYGRFTPQESLIPFFIVGASVLAYRVILTLVAPVWILRSDNVGGQTRAFGVTLLAALFISVALNSLFALYYVTGQATSDMSIFFFTIKDPLLNVAGTGLALALYRGSGEGLRLELAEGIEQART